MVTNQIENEFHQRIFSKESPAFHFIVGTYGVGKSFLINRTLNYLKGFKDPYVALIFTLPNIQHFSTLSNYLKVQTNIHQSLWKSIHDELNFFQNHYNLLLDELGKNSNFAFLKKIIINNYSCFDYFQSDYLFKKYPLLELEEYSKKISELFEKNVDRRVLLYFFEVQAESILATILNFVLQNKQLELKPLVLFIFDDYETSAGTIDWWAFNILASFLKKSLNDFIAYRFKDENVKISDLINLKFIFSSRHHFSVSKFQNSISELDYSLTTIKHFVEEDLVQLDWINDIPNSLKIENIIEKSYGIFSNLLILKDLDFDLSSTENKRFFFTKVWNKISSQISLPLENFLKMAFEMPYFGEEFIRFFFNNYYDYHRLVQYFIEEKEVFQMNSSEQQLFSIQPHYFEVLNSVLTLNSEFANDYKLICEKFKIFYQKYGYLSSRSRKIVRSLAYFDNFDFGYVTQKVFGEDFDSVRLFVQINPEFFESENNLFHLKREHKKFLAEINQLVDAERYEQKRRLLGETINSFREYAIDEIVRLKDELVKVQTEHLKNEAELNNLDDETKILLSKIITKQNELNLLRDKYSKIGKKVPTAIFISLVFFSILFFILGNNLSQFFNSNFQNDFVGGLGISLKFFSIVLFGAFLYLIINFLTSRTRHHQFENLKNEINLLEGEYLTLKSRLTDLKFSVNELNKKIEQNTKQKEAIHKRIQELEKSQQINYINTTY